MAIIGTLPNSIQNGQSVDANPVMADFNFIVNQVNANAVPLGTLAAPSGTRVAFQQAAAPLGWTTDATLTDHTLRVAASTGGSINSAGTAYGNFLSGSWSSDSHTLSVAEMPSHSHSDAGHGHSASDSGHTHGQPAAGQYTVAGGANSYVLGSGNSFQNVPNSGTGVANVSIGTGNANIQNTGGGGGHNHNFSASTWKYADFIVAVKT